MKNISCDEFNTWRQTKKEYILVDVREQHEWEQEHFREAQHVPLSAWPSAATLALPDKQARIVLCCASGGRSAKAAEYLSELGYHHIYNLLNGVHGYCTFYPNSL